MGHEAAASIAREAAAAIRSRTSVLPVVGIVAGSGLATALDGLVIEEDIGYGELPGFPVPSVPGHDGRLRLGAIAGTPVAAFLGRFHYYEGHSMAVASLPVRVARLLGAGTMVLTAAVGGLSPGLRAGAVVVGSDHLNMMGASPLRGWRNPDGSPPFVDLTGAYDRGLREVALERARELGVAAAEGVYAAMAGPSYETPAETALLRRQGAAVVGMSVVPESIPARALGMRVLALYAVTNEVGQPVDHASVLRTSHDAAVSIGRLLAEVLPLVEPKGA
jgi:inosine/guanosine/xanthosine phosphorylase family protein